LGSHTSWCWRNKQDPIVVANHAKDLQFRQYLYVGLVSAAVVERDIVGFAHICPTSLLPYYLITVIVISS
jgi:hypothetical protein